MYFKTYLHKVADVKVNLNQYILKLLFDCSDPVKKKKKINFIQ